MEAIERREQDIEMAKVQFENHAQAFTEEIDRIEKCLLGLVQQFVIELRQCHEASLISHKQLLQPLTRQIEKIRSLSDEVNKMKSTISTFHSDCAAVLEYAVERPQNEASNNINNTQTN